MQHTLKAALTLNGIGLHSGAPVTMTIRPAPADHGLVFVRADVAAARAFVPALWSRVVDTRLCTVVGNDHGVTVATIEHLMAALRGCGIDNALIELDGPEVPAMDGSAAPFVAAIDETGIEIQKAPRRAIRVLKEIVVEAEGKRARLSPAPCSTFSGQIEFSHPVIGKQFFITSLVNGNFRHDLAEARTFGFAEEVAAMREKGLALGGSLDNAIVLDKGRVMNREGLRFNDEFIRHKLLDAVGDLYLAGGPIIGAYEGFRAGHALNNALLRRLFATKDAWARADQFLPEEETAAAQGRAAFPALSGGRAASVAVA